MKRWLAGILVVCLLCGLCLTGCGDDGTGKGFRFPLAAEPQQLDPQVAADSASTAVLSVLFEGLTRLDATGKAVPGAADWTVSDDGLVYTFTLRESYWSTLTIRGEAPWSDPLMVTADDFVFGLQRAVSPQTGSTWATHLYDVQNARAIHEGTQPLDTLGVRAVDERVLTITLTSPDPHFPAVLAATPCMPCHREFFTITAGRYGLEKDYLLTNGPFVLTAWNHDESLLLHKNPYYHATDSISPEAVRFVIQPDDEAAALQSGALDAAALTAAQYDAAQKAGVQVVPLEDSIRSVYFNTRVSPLSIPTVRQALRDAIEWERIHAYLQEAGELPATGYVAPAAVVAENEPYRTAKNALSFETNLAQARTALGKGLQTLSQQQGASDLPRLTVLAAEDETSANLARYCIQSWQKNLKVYAELELLSEADLAGRVKAGRYDVAIYTATATGLTSAENLQAYTTGNAANLTGLSNAAVDAAVAAALAGGRAQAEAAEALLWQTCPSLPLSFPCRYYGIAAGNEGITVRPFGGGVYGAALDFLHAKKWD